MCGTVTTKDILSIDTGSYPCNYNVMERSCINTFFLITKIISSSSHQIQFPPIEPCPHGSNSNFRTLGYFPYLIISITVLAIDVGQL